MIHASAQSRQAALSGEITVKNGRVEQTNFGNCRVLRIHEVPRINVVLVAQESNLKKG